MPSDSSSSHPPGQHARREVLGALALALKLMAERILPQADAALEVAELAARAEELATRAWELAGARIPDRARAEALQVEFRDFIEHAVDLSARAAHDAAACREAGGAMERHASDLTSLARSPEAGDIAVLRARLRPIVASLEQLPVRIASSKVMAEDVVALGARAAKLGDEAMAAQGHRIAASDKALALYRSLRGIADEAGVLAANMLADSQRLRGTIGGIATQVGQIAT